PVGLQALLELLGFERLGAEVEDLLERGARLVRRLAGRAAIRRREARDRTEYLGELGLAAEVVHAQLVELLDGAGLGDPRLGLAAELIEPGVRHGRPSYIGLWRLKRPR